MSTSVVRRVSIGSVLTLLAALLAVVALPDAAVAATATSPSAIAVGPDGTTYVAYPSATEVVRLDVDGTTLDPLTLPRTGSIDGLAVAPDGNLWVALGGGALKIAATTGAELQWFNYGSDVPDVCPYTSGPTDPRTYGGIAVTPDSVYVSLRCGDGDVARYGPDGVLRTRISLPSGQAGGLNVGPASAGRTGEALYVTEPDTGRIVVLASGSSFGPTPIRTIQLQAYAGGTSPRPTDVTIDDTGFLFTVDTANHVIYALADGGTSYTRHLGHPPEPGTDLGSLDEPVALAAYPRSGSVRDMQGDLLVAEAGNRRVQRWNTFGLTLWAAASDGNAANTGPPPENVVLPSVQGSPYLGRSLRCTQGDWTESPTSFTFGWNRDGVFIAGEASSTYVVTPADVGKRVSCFVRASNDGGDGDFATSSDVLILSGTVEAETPPSNVVAPEVGGVAGPGETLSCTDGEWAGSPLPTYDRWWLRDGERLDGAVDSTYLVSTDDVDHELACEVTATSPVGTATATSEPVTVTDEPVVVVPTPCPGRPAVLIDAGALTTRRVAVTLGVNAPPGATGLLIANDRGFGGVQEQSLAVGCSYRWNITPRSKPATSVYVRFVGPGVDESAVVSDQILLDAAAPVLTSSQIRRSGKRHSVRLDARDPNGTGVALLQHGRTKKTTRTVTFRSRYTTSKPQDFTWVRIRDRAGNTSPWLRSRFPS